MALDDDITGGFSNYYNPAFGLMAIQQPEMFVQHLASKGIQPPADFPDDFSHRDAHTMLARNDSPQMPEQLQTPAQRRAWQNMSPTQQRNASEYWKSGDPAALDRPQGQMQPPAQAPQPPAAPPPDSGTTRYNFQPLNGPGASTTLPNRDNGGFGRNLMQFAPDDFARDLSVQNPDAPFALPVKPQPPKTPIPEGTTPALERPVASMSPVPTTPLPRPRPTDVSEPTPPSDAPSTAGGAALPQGSSPTQPGGLNTEDPNAKATAAAEDKKKAKKDDSQDSFGKALAGLSAMKTPTPVFPHPGNLPHPSNQISRSTLPTELLKEMSSIGHPGQLLRLGQALRGR